MRETVVLVLLVGEPAAVAAASSELQRTLGFRPQQPFPCLRRRKVGPDGSTVSLEAIEAVALGHRVGVMIVEAEEDRVLLPAATIEALATPRPRHRKLDDES